MVDCPACLTQKQIPAHFRRGLRFMYVCNKNTYAHGKECATELAYSIPRKYESRVNKLLRQIKLD